MASNAAPDSGEYRSLAASTTNHRVFGKTLGALLKRPVAISDIVLVAVGCATDDPTPASYAPQNDIGLRVQAREYFYFSFTDNYCQKNFVSSVPTDGDVRSDLNFAQY